jgi:hypothetical protein
LDQAVVLLLLLLRLLLLGSFPAEAAKLWHARTAQPFHQARLPWLLLLLVLLVARTRLTAGGVACTGLLAAAPFCTAAIAAAATSSAACG